MEIEEEKYLNYTKLGNYRCIKTLGKSGTESKTWMRPNKQTLVTLKILLKEYTQ